MFVRYIKEQIIWWYIMESTIYDEAKLNSFMFDAIGVVMDLNPIIPNLFRISIVYFPYAKEITYAFFHTSMRRK